MNVTCSDLIWRSLFLSAVTHKVNVHYRNLSTRSDERQNTLETSASSSLYCGNLTHINLFGTKFSSSLVYCWVTIFQHLLSIYFFDFTSFSVYYFSHWYVIWQPWPCGERNFFLGEKNFSMTFCTGISGAHIYRHKETFLHITNFWMILLEIIGFVTRHGNNITGQNKWIPRIREKHKFWNYWLMSQLAGVWIL